MTEYLLTWEAAGVISVTAENEIEAREIACDDLGSLPGVTDVAVETL